MNDLDWSEYEVKPEVEPEDFSQYEVKPEAPKQESLISSLGGLGPRKAAQFGLEALENFLGLPASLNNLIATGVEKGAEAIAGQELPSVRNVAQKFRETGKTPEYFREKEQQILGKTFEPQDQSEEAIREIGGDVGAFLNPIGGFMAPVKALGLALVGKGTKEAAGLFTSSEGKKDASKIGAMFLTDLLLRKAGGQSAKKFIDGLYDTERSLVPQGTKTLATTLENEVNDVIKSIDQSNVSTASSRLVKTTAESLLKDVVNGEAEVHGLLTAKRRLNELRGAPELLKHEEPLLNRLSRGVEDTLENYGGSAMADPSFYGYHKSANEAYATMAKSRTISRFIGKNIPKSASHLVLGLLGELVTGHASLIPGTLGAAVGLTAAVRSGELLYQIMASPSLRRHYLKVLSEAAAQNSRGVAKAISELDTALQKDKSFQEE